MAAGSLFKQAAAYRKKHPGMTMPEAVKACSKKSKPAARKKAAAKKRPVKRAVGKVARTVPKKVKIKIRKTKGGNVNLGISGVSLNELNRQLLHLKNLERIEWSTKELLKDKRHKEAWSDLRRQLAKNKHAIAATKKHITALKRSI